MNQLNQMEEQPQNQEVQYPQKEEVDSQFYRENPRYEYPNLYQNENNYMNQYPNQYTNDVVYNNQEMNQNEQNNQFPNKYPNVEYMAYAQPMYQQNYIEEEEEELPQYEICENCGIELNMPRYFRINGKPVCSFQCMEVFRNKGALKNVETFCPECEKEKQNRIKNCEEECSCEKIVEKEETNIAVDENNVNNNKNKRINKCEICSTRIGLNDILYLSQDGHGFCSLQCRSNYEQY